MSTAIEYTVIGAGNGGKAMAAHLALMGFQTALYNRYLFENIPMSLVPIAALGQCYSVSTGGIDSIIKLACIVHRTDYWRRGRKLDKLGIDRLSVSEITCYVNDGARE